MATPDGGVTANDLLIVEYQCLKEEQKTRINTRDNLLYATLAAMAAVIAAAVNLRHAAHLLLLLPPVTVILGWTYLVNDQKISASGRYIREHLAPSLIQDIGGTTPIFAWESVHRMDASRTSRKILQLVVDLLTFFLLPLCAIVAYWGHGPHQTVLLIVSALEVLVLLVLATQVIRYADWRS